MVQGNFVIRGMTRADLDLALDWAAAEGWNPGLVDGDPFYAADPQGFLIAELGGERIGVISAVRYGTDFGFVGFFIVRPDRRGQGYGTALFRAALDHLRGRCVGLDGVLAKQDSYRRDGFADAHRNMRFQGQTGGMALAPPPGLRLAPLSTLPFAATARYDRAFFASERDDFLARWIAMPGCTALGLVDGADALAGYGVIRPCRVGYKIGPLFADSDDGAECLFTALAAAAPAGAAMFLDPPECNPAAVALTRRHGMSMVFETARMYTRPAPALAPERTYGITSFELG